MRTVKQEAIQCVFFFFVVENFCNDSRLSHEKKKKNDNAGERQGGESGVRKLGNVDKRTAHLVSCVFASILLYSFNPRAQFCHFERFLFLLVSWDVQRCHVHRVHFSLGTIKKKKKKTFSSGHYIVHVFIHIKGRGCFFLSISVSLVRVKDKKKKTEKNKQTNWIIMIQNRITICIYLMMPKGRGDFFDEV